MEWASRGYNMTQPYNEADDYFTFRLDSGYSEILVPFLLTTPTFSMNNTRTTQKQERATAVRNTCCGCLPTRECCDTLSRYGEVRISVTFSRKGCSRLVLGSLRPCTLHGESNQIRICRATAHLQRTFLRFTYYIRNLRPPVTYISSIEHKQHQNGAGQVTHELDPHPAPLLLLPFISATHVHPAASL